MIRRSLIAGGLVFSLFIAGCGDSDTGLSGGPVALYITDDPGDQFPGVEVTLFSVNLCSDSGCANPVNLYDNPTGRTIDLAGLSGILELIHVAEIPDRSYNRLEVGLDRIVTITEANGAAHSAYFDPETENLNKPNVVLCPPEFNERCLIRFNGAVQPFAMGKLIIDFVLKDFEIDRVPCPGVSDLTSWCVTEVKMMPLTPGELNEDMKFKITGVVSEIFSASIAVATTFTDYTVVPNEMTKCEFNGSEVFGVDACLAGLNVGICIEVESPEDPAIVTTLTAHEIEVEDSSDCS